jgi:LysM repeat protein
MKYVLLVVLVLFAGRALADDGYVHVVRPGETLASIANHYYGDERRESVLVAENGLNTQGGAAIVVGLRLVIPRVAYHRVAAGQTWAQIATEHYGDPRRASAIIDANPQVSGAQPDEGAELLVPYPLRHVARQNDTMRRIAQMYYGDAAEGTTRLMRFNASRRQRLSRGQIVLVPLDNLVLSEEGRQAIETHTEAPVETGELRSLQANINAELPTLREHVRRGRYPEAIAVGNRLLGSGELTGNQIVTIQRELASAYVALDREDLAITAFLAALEHQPDLELDSRRTSPTILRAFTTARERLTARPDAAGDAGVPDAGVPGAP